MTSRARHFCSLYQLPAEDMTAAISMQNATAKKRFDRRRLPKFEKQAVFGPLFASLPRPRSKFPRMRSSPTPIYKLLIKYTTGIDSVRARQKAREFLRTPFFFGFRSRKGVLRNAFFEKVSVRACVHPPRSPSQDKSVKERGRRERARLLPWSRRVDSCCAGSSFNMYFPVRRFRQEVAYFLRRPPFLRNEID